jgi:acyl-CoA thioester hydrolase
MDNDLYGHVNNVVYYSYFDTVVNRYLIDPGGLDIHKGTVVGIVAETQCRFFKSFTYPELVDAGLRVGRLGNSSVRYEIGLFGEGEDAARAEGHFVHVFVDRASNKPVPIPPGIRAALQRLVRA